MQIVVKDAIKPHIAGFFFIILYVQLINDNCIEGKKKTQITPHLEVILFVVNYWILRAGSLLVYGYCITDLIKYHDDVHICTTSIKAKQWTC